MNNLPNWFDDFADVPVILTVMTAFFTGLFWVIRKEVNSIKHEMFPNSGKSMRDAIDRIENKVDSHIEWHMNKEK